MVAAPAGHESEVEAAVAGAAEVLTGGASRSESVALALTGVETELVAVHDAARPLALPALFDAVLAALAGDPNAAGALAAAPVADTVKRAHADHERVVGETVSRQGLWAVQTPQAFRTGALRAALDVPAEELAAATDDATLVERAGGRVLLEPAPAWNLKVTTSDDLRLAELLLRARGD